MDINYIEKHIIFETIIGSRAYGTHHENSDWDKSGVMILGLGSELGFDNIQEFRDYPGEDKVIYNLKKALMLIADNNPNMLDLVWMPERCILKTTKYWNKVIEKRSELLSQRCRATYSGYAFMQLERIKTHRFYLLNPPKEPPNRENFGLPKISIFKTAHLKSICSAVLELVPDEKKEKFCNDLDAIYSDYVLPLLDRYLSPEERILGHNWLQSSIKSQINSFLNIGNKFLKDEYFEMAIKEAAYLNALNEWKRYLHWKKSRNKARAALEEKCGFDSKHASHLVRLLKMGKEILETGIVNVDRTNIDAEELKEIRHGSWSFEKVEEYAYKMDKGLSIACEKSKLPKLIDYEAVKNLCLEILKQYHLDNKFEF